MKGSRSEQMIKKHGYDYGVLIKVWDLTDKVKYKVVTSDEDEIEVLQDYLNDVIANEFAGDSCIVAKNVKHTLAEVARDLRTFLRELSSYNNTYYSPMWRGMSEIEDDYSLVRIVIPIVGYMWD